MKYNLVFLLFCSCTLFAQSRTEFGFTLNAGNFALPQNGPGPRPSGYTHSSNALSAGFTAAAGVYGSLPVYKPWSVSACLLYAVSAFSFKESFNYDPQYEQYMLLENKWTRKYTEHNLLFPVQVQYTFRKTVAGLGLCPSVNLFTQQKSDWLLASPENEAVQRYQARAYFRQGNLAWPGARLQCLWVASLNRKLGKNTSIGLQCMWAPRHNELAVYFNAYEDKVLLTRSPFRMKSVMVALRRSLINK